MPDEEELMRFAGAYLQMQREHWPDLADRGLLPEPKAAVTKAMAESYRRIHMGEQSATFDPAPFHGLVAGFGMMYPRYSAETSQTTSIIDQARNILRKAKADGRFVP
ncbi:MAG: hypothetical protein GC162_17515 [Planctomycetes bacterium]|nr:hypothetical protein [Planctomycetota bacterium]